MSDEMIICEICGEKTHAIQIHLKKVHGEGSDEPCALEEYKERFPEAPLYSKRALEKIGEKRKQKESLESSDEKKCKEPMAKLFKLGDAKAAKTPGRKRHHGRYMSTGWL